MAEASFFQDQFSCSVCLDLLKDPVTIPCGHSYCMSCITHYWEDQKSVSCPQCRNTFSPKPALCKNVMFAEIVEKLNSTNLQTARPAHDYAGPGDVECDVCLGRKYKAVKSCVKCLNSYCQSHLEQHENLLKDRMHDLIDPAKQLHEVICPKHNKQLKNYCRTDQKSICFQCMMDEHQNHDTVTVEAERTEKQRLLLETQTRFQQKIEERQKQLQKLRDAVKSHKSSAQTAVEDLERIFTELICSIKRTCSEVTQRIRDQEKAAVSQAEGLLETLEQDINILRRRDSELNQLSHTENHINFLQMFQYICADPEFIDITVSSLPSFHDVVKSIFMLKEKLEGFCKEELEKISDRGTCIERTPSTEVNNRKDLLKYLCQLTLDSNTVNCYLQLSKGNRAATRADKAQQYPVHPDRFDGCVQVLCSERVCGRSYWDIKWKGNKGVCISVSYRSISRKGSNNECLFGFNHQSWGLYCFPSNYLFRHNKEMTEIPVSSKSSRIGVYVDHSAGTLCFYSISGTMTLIHKVQTTFTQPLYPGFGLNIGSKVKLC